MSNDADDGESLEELWYSTLINGKIIWVLCFSKFYDKI